MKILLVDVDGCALDWAMRCKMVGHDVKHFIREVPHPVKTGHGVIERVNDWEKWMRWAELVFVTGNIQYMHALQKYHDMGYPIFGANKATAKLELNRLDGIKAIEKCGLKGIPSKMFHDYDSAIRHVKSSKKRMVSKPNGEADKAMTYVAPKEFSVEAMCYMLDRWNQNPKYRQDAKKHGFILQEFVPGIEIGVSGWFGPGGWNKWHTLNFEEKALMAGGMGPSTGEMGTTIVYVSEKDRLVQEMLRPLTPILEKMKYCGDIDVNCIVAEDGQPDFLEHTCRPGWPAWIIETSLRLGDPAKPLVDLVHGIDSLEVSKDVAVGFVVAQPDFPYSRLTGKLVEKIPVYGFGDWAHHHPCDMMMVDGQWQTTRDYVAVVTGAGATVNGAKRSAMAAFKKLSIPNSAFIRNDISDRLQEQLPILQKYGYAKGIVF